MKKESDTNFPGWSRVLLIIIPWFFISGLFYFIGALIVGYDFWNYNSPQSLEEEVILSLFGLAGTCLTVCVFHCGVGRESFQSMGFYKPGMIRELATGMVLGAVILSLGFALLLLSGEIRIVSSSLELKKIFLLVILYVAVAVNEELLFRGYILNNLMKSFSRGLALFITSISFSLIHLGNSHYSLISFLNILLVGVLLGLPYIYTKSLWIPVALHFSWNFFQGGVWGFHVSGNTIYYSINVQTKTSDNYLNGGDFGFEGSLLCAIIQLIAIFLLWRYYERKLPSANAGLTEHGCRSEF